MSGQSRQNKKYKTEFQQQVRNNNVLQFTQREDHFDPDSQNMVQPKAGQNNSRHMIPAELDYMAGQQTPRQMYEQPSPIKVELKNDVKLGLTNISQVAQQQQIKNTVHKEESKGSRPFRSSPQTEQDDPFAYEPLDMPKQQKAKEEKKNHFWKCLDPSEWIDDKKAQSCQYCFRDFTLTRRRHHCRKCGGIFCHDHISKRTIAGVNAKMCTSCQHQYDQYDQYEKPKILMTRLNKRELEAEEQQSAASRIGLNIPDYRGMIADTSHTVDTLEDQSTQQEVQIQGALSNDRQDNFTGNDSLVDTSLGLPGDDEDFSDVDSQQSAGQLGCYMDEQFSNGNGRKMSTESRSDSKLDETLRSSGATQAYLMEYSRRHIQKVVCEQLFINELSLEKWESLLSGFVMKAVEQVKPSSRMLKDPMDINEAIKVKIIDWKDNSKSQYVNGFVMSKSIASKRMETCRINPKILLLKDLAQEDARSSNFIIPDLATKIDLEEHTDKILEQRISEISPDLVIVQKDVPFKLLNMMRDKKITVVCGLEDRKMKRLARLTQTIVLPSLNVIDVPLGHCKLFREDNLSRQLRGQDAYFTNTHTVEQTLLVFDGCQSVLGCTICLSGPVRTEGQELIKVKKALKQMLVIAKNIVLERSFLTQIQCLVPAPPMDDQEEEPGGNPTVKDRSRSRKDQKAMTLENLLHEWEMTDIYTPYLITNYVKNRATLVYKKIKIWLKQRDQTIPSGPTTCESELPEYCNDTLGEFMNNVSEGRRDTYSGDGLTHIQKPEEMMAEGRLKVNEKYVQTKLDRMCGEPKDAILYFSRQDIPEGDKKQRNDCTLGKYLEGLAESAKAKCTVCHNERYMHSQEIYHREGQLQITIKPSQQNTTVESQSNGNNMPRNAGPNSHDLTFNESPETGYRQQAEAKNDRQRTAGKKIQIYAFCKTCARYCSRNLVSSQLYEYSKARFFEQFFYNDKLKVKQGAFPCDHGSHPLRDYVIEFAVEQCKIQFRYTPADIYAIQMVNPKKYSSRESLRMLVQDEKEHLQDNLEKALENFKLDQVEVLKSHIVSTINEYDMKNETKYRGTNMTVFVAHLKKITDTLDSMSNDFHEFQEAAAQELAKFKDELLALMFLKRKILMTFLGYQRAIDETIQQLALLTVVATRRARVIDYQLSQADVTGNFKHSTYTAGQRQTTTTAIDGRDSFMIIDGEEVSVHVQSQYTGQNLQSQSLLSGNSFTYENENESVASGVVSQSKQGKRMVGNRLSGHQADIVQEEDEKEEDEASMHKKDESAKHSGDGMASVGEHQKTFSNSDLSDTSIKRMEGSFNRLELSSQRSVRGSSATRKGKLRSRALLHQQSFASEAEMIKESQKLSRSIERGNQRLSEAGAGNGGSQKKFGHLNRRPSANEMASLGKLHTIPATQHLAQARREIQASELQEDSIEEDENYSEALQGNKKHCFIEELCTCIIKEPVQNKNDHNSQYKRPKLSHMQSMPLQFRTSTSMQVFPGETHAMMSIAGADAPDPSQSFQQEEPDSGTFNGKLPNNKDPNQHFNTMAQSVKNFDKADTMQPSQQRMQVAVTNQNYNSYTQMNSQMLSVKAVGLKSQQMSQITSPAGSTRTGYGLRQVRRPVTFCHMSGQMSSNKYCGMVPHVLSCYQKMIHEVADLRNLLEKAIYFKSQAVNRISRKVIILNEPDQKVANKSSPTAHEQKKFGQQGFGGQIAMTVKESSQIDGFDTIAVEKKPQKGTVADQDEDYFQDSQNLHEFTNRVGTNLQQDYDFIKVPKQQSESPGHYRPQSKPQKPSGSPRGTAHARESKRVADPPEPHKWLKVDWIEGLAKANPTLPFGYDNTNICVNREDPGSIIAFALTSNIYLEGLAKLDYMELDQILTKQQTNNNHNNYELLDKDDVLNDKHITHAQMEAEMLCRNKISLAIKFGTHLKDVRISIKNGREQHEYAHAERHFKTGVTEKRRPTKHNIDLQSVGGRSNYTRTETLKSSVTTLPTNQLGKAGKNSKPEIKSKKIFNDYHLKVLPKYPKEYLRNHNVTEVFNELEEVQGDLCRSYFSHDQIQQIKHFVNYKPEQNLEKQSQRTYNNSPTLQTSHETLHLQHNNSMEVVISPTGEVINMNAETISMANQSMAFGSDGKDQEVTQRFIDDNISQYMALQNANDMSIDQQAHNTDSVQQSPNVTNGVQQFSAGGFVKSTLRELDKRKLKNFVKEQSKKPNERDENILKLEEGAIFGVRSPSRQILNEQKDASKFLNEELKIRELVFEVRIFFPKRFSGLRRFYIGSHLDYIMSICRTQAWQSSGGKASKGFFTTHDKKFVFKSVKREEFEMFCSFGPTYFDYMAKSFFHNFPCCIAKIVGAYEVIITDENDRDNDSRTFILASENLNLGLKPEDEPNLIRFDLKGSENNRLATPPIGPDGRLERVVLLDSNFLFKMRARPVCLPFEDALKLHICISNDVDCLKKMNIVDYSLLAVIDTKRKKIRFGILDYCQFFNSKKQVEYMLKQTVNLGGLPTIVPAELYRYRFVTFMTNHFIGVSNQLKLRPSSKKHSSTREHKKRPSKEVRLEVLGIHEIVPRTQSSQQSEQSSSEDAKKRTNKSIKLSTENLAKQQNEVVQQQLSPQAKQLISKVRSVQIDTTAAKGTQQIKL